MQTTTHVSAIQTNGSVGNGLRSPLIAGLGALLAVQLLVALLMGLGGNDLSPAKSQGPLLAFEIDQVTGLRIASGDSELVLKKADDAWQLPSLGGFPVTEFKIAELLDKLAGIQKRIPVATTEAAIARFKVADDDFERRLTLESTDGPLGTLYLGDSPGFRRLFVRADGEQAVYEAELALFDASDKADDWTKKTVLQLEQDRIQGLVINDLVLTRSKEDIWTLDGLTESEVLNQDAVKNLVRLVANINFRSVLGSENKPEYGQDAPVLTFKITLDEETLEYRLSKPPEGDDHVIKVSNRPNYFSLSQYSVEDLTNAKLENLVSSADPAAQEGAAETDEPVMTTD